MGTVLTFALSSCATTRAVEHVAQKGYLCRVASRDGGFKASATLDDSGRQIRAQWSWQNTFGDHLFSVRAGQAVFGPVALSETAASGSISWARPRQGRERKREVRLELSTVAEASQAASFTGFYESPRTYHNLSARWPDLLALASTSSSLFLVLRDKRGAILDQRSINATIIQDGPPVIAAGLTDLRATVAKFNQQCRAVEDVYP
jgi:hypothetical protein